MNLLIVIDMQKDFIDGVLGNNETAAIAPPVAEKIKKFREENPDTPVIYTMDTHFENYMDTLEGKNLPVPHCIENSEGWQLDKQVAEVIGENAVMVKKLTFGAIELPKLIEDKFGAPDKIELIGVCTDICVISNAMLLKAAFPNVPIAVDAKCCAGVTPQRHDNALNAMRACQIEVK